MTTLKNFPRQIALFLLAIGFAGPATRVLHADPFQKTAVAKPKLKVAITTDIAPYVMKDATTGLEVDLARQLLKGYSLHFVQMPYSELQTAVREKGVDVSFGVQPTDKNVAYSANFITFVNVAISKKTDSVKIRNVADLANCPVLAWQNAYFELGTEFKTLFSPNSPHRKNYQEIANQKKQVEMFWKAKNAVIVIDRAVFTALSREMGHSMSDITSNAIFPAETDFRAAFKKASVRDQFDRRLAELCKSGGYADIYRDYDVALPFSVCDRQGVEAATAQFYSALNSLFTGDVGPMSNLWSHGDEVTYMGPIGGMQVGWDQVLANWQEQAALKLGGTVKPHDIRITLSRNLAVVHNFEIGENFAGNEKREKVSIRATSVFRKESGTWKMIGHHTDLLPFLKK